MADTGTSGEPARAENDSKIRAMRAGEDLDGEAPKKGKKKPILVVLLVLLMAGGGAAFMLMPEQAPDEHAAAPIPEPVIVEPEKLFYIDLDPLFVPFKTPAGARHKVVVMLSLEVGRSRHQ